jgi:small subunit ribosomal protein S16
MGKKNQPLFRIVLVEKTAPPKGKYIEKLGSLDPIRERRNLYVERIKYWLGQGAKPSDTVYNLLIKEKILEGPKRKIKIKPRKSKVESRESKKSKESE